jgi:pyruvate dehydrogenase E2 component (dihydrolipoamide acetyltransferase)
MKLGDPIKKGDTIAEVETDKAVMEVTAFHDGYLAGPLALEGTEMPDEAEQELEGIFAS